MNTSSPTPGPPTPRPEKPKLNGGLNALVKAEQLLQIAFILPASVIIGLGIGVLLDRWLHQHWIYIVGLIFGIIAGMVETVRQALHAGRK